MDGGERDEWFQEEGKNWMFLSSTTVGLTPEANTLSRPLGAGESPDWQWGDSSSARG